MRNSWIEPVNYLLLEASVFEPLKRMAKRIVVLIKSLHWHRERERGLHTVFAYALFAL